MGGEKKLLVIFDPDHETAKPSAFKASSESKYRGPNIALPPSPNGDGRSGDILNPVDRQAATI